MFTKTGKAQTQLFPRDVLFSLIRFRLDREYGVGCVRIRKSLSLSAVCLLQHFFSTTITRMVREMWRAPIALFPMGFFNEDRYTLGILQQFSPGCSFEDERALGGNNCNARLFHGLGKTPGPPNGGSHGYPILILPGYLLSKASAIHR